MRRIFEKAMNRGYVKLYHNSEFPTTADCPVCKKRFHRDKWKRNEYIHPRYVFENKPAGILILFCSAKCKKNYFLR